MADGRDRDSEKGSSERAQPQVAAGHRLADFVATIVSDPAAARSFTDAWRALAVERQNPFISPEWAESWLGTYGEGARPQIAHVRRPDGSTAGVLPLMIRKKGRSRILQFIGSGLADHLEPAARADDQPGVAYAAARALAHDKEWSAAIFENVDVAAPWVGAYRKGHGDRLARFRLHESRLAFTPIAGMDWEAFDKRRKPGIRQNRRRRLRRLEKSHEVKYVVAQGDAEIAASMSALWRLHDLRRNEKGGSSLDERSRVFLVDFARRTDDVGWARVLTLTVDETPVAASYSWSIGGRYLLYQKGFDPAWRNHGVGALIDDGAVRDAISRGDEVFDLLLGDEDYKVSDGYEFAPVETLMLSRPFRLTTLTGAVDQVARSVYGRLPDKTRAKWRRYTRSLAGLLPSNREH